MTAEQPTTPERLLVNYARLVNKTFEPRGESLDPAVLVDAQRSQLFMESVDRVLGMLPDRYRQVMELHYGLLDGNTHSLEEIGRRLPRLRGGGVGVRRETARAIEIRAMRRIRHLGTSREIRPFLVEESPPTS